MDPSFSVFQFPKRDVSPLPLITLHIDILTIIQTAKNSCINFETWSTLSFKYTICKCTINTVTPIKQWNIKLTINYDFEQSIQGRTMGGGSFLLAFPFLRQSTFYILHCNALHSPSDRIVYLNIFKKDINIFSKKGFLRGGHNVTKGGTIFFCAPPPTQMRSYAPETQPLCNVHRPILVNKLVFKLYIL